MNQQATKQLNDMLARFKAHPSADERGAGGNISDVAHVGVGLGGLQLSESQPVSAAGGG